MAGPIAYYEVRWRLSTSDEEWTYARLEVNQTQITITGVDRTKTYTIEARSVGPTGLTSVWVDISHTVSENVIPDIPLGLTASSAPDAVKLEWYFDRTQPSDVEILIERSTSGAVDTWFQAAVAKGTVALIKEDAPQTFYYRARTRNYYDKYSLYTDAVSAAPNIINLGTKNLTISGGVVEVDCNYKNFYLLLTSNVTSVNFINVSSADTVIIHIEQTGTFTMNFGSGVTPITGSSYTTSQFAGALDVVGLHTVDAGATWKMAYQKPEGDGNTSVVVSITPSPAYDSETVVSGVAVQPLIHLSALATGGDEIFTYLWECVDNGGQTQFNINSNTMFDPTLSIASGTSAYDCTQVWRVTVTDGGGLQDVETVSVRLERINSGTGSGTFNVTADPLNPFSVVTVTGSEPAPVVATTQLISNNETGTVTWSATKLSGTGPTPTISSGNDPTATWRIASGTTNVEHAATWRFTGSDSGTGQTDYVDVEVYLSRSNNM